MRRSTLLLMSTCLALSMTAPAAWPQDSVAPAAQSPITAPDAPVTEETSAAAPAAPTTQPKTAIPASTEINAPSTSTTLIDSLVTTYENNPTIKAQRKQLASVDEQMPQALSGFLPTATFDYSRGRQRTEYNNGAPESLDTKNSQLTVTEPLFRGFRTWNSVTRAENLIESARADLKDTEQRILLDGVTAYMNVVRDRAVLELSKNNEDVLKQQLQGSNDRFEVGEITRTDVAQSESRLSRATADRIQAEGTLTASVSNYKRIVGVAPGELQPPAAVPELPATLEAAIEEGLKNNPVVISIGKRSEAAEDDTNIQIGTLLPEVNLQGTISEQEGTGLLGDNTFEENAVTVNARIPLYQSGAEYSRVREAKQIESQRRYQFRDQQDRVSDAVTKAWEDVRTSESTIKAQQDAIRAAAIALDGVRQEQLYGARTILDVLDAEQEQFVAKVNLVRAQRDYWVSIHNLLATTGHLTLDDLGVKGKTYDPTEHYDDVKYQFIGF